MTTKTKATGTRAQKSALIGALLKAGQKVTARELMMGKISMEAAAERLK